MMNLKVCGSICILVFVLLVTVSAQNNTTTTAPPPSATTTAAPPLPATTTAATTTAAATTAAPPPPAAATTTAEPPTTQPTTEPSKDAVVTTKQSRIDAKARITSVEYEDVKDLTSDKGKAFKKDFEGKMLGVMKQKHKLVIDVKVTGFRSGSVIVEYYLVLNTTSEAEAAKIANAVTEVIKSGQIGNYTIDPHFKPDAYITRKVKASEVLAALNSKCTSLIP